MKYVLLLCSIAVSLLMCEWVVRRVPSISQELLSPLFTDDPDYVFKLKPHLKATHKLKPATIDTVYHTNSLGYRSPEFKIEKPAGVKRVICLGDSLTFGMGGPDDESYPYQLDGMLKSQIPQAEVVNAGQPGWGTGQQLRWLEKEGLAMSPDGLVLAFFPNDFDNDAQYGILTLENGQLKRNQLTRPGITQARRITEKIPFYQFFAENSVLFNYVRRAILVRIQYKDEKRDFHPAVKSEAEQKAEADRQLHEMSVLSLAEMKEFQSICAKNDIHFLVLLIPDMKSVFLDETDDAHPYWKVYKRARANAAQLKLPAIDLKVELHKWAESNRTPLESLFLPVDQHFTKQGNAVVAGILKERMMKEWFAETAKAKVKA